MYIETDLNMLGIYITMYNQKCSNTNTKKLSNYHYVANMLGANRCVCQIMLQILASNT